MARGGVLTGLVGPWGPWRLPHWCGWWSCGPAAACADPPVRPGSPHPDGSSCCTTDSWREQDEDRADVTQGMEKTISCEVWKETGWQNIEAACYSIRLDFQVWLENSLQPLVMSSFSHHSLTSCEQNGFSRHGCRTKIHIIKQGETSPVWNIIRL